MLIDEVLAHKGLSGALEKIPMLSGLRTAHAFVLTGEAQDAASHLMKTASSPATISDQFRLPYPQTWVEASVDAARLGFYLDGRCQPPERLVSIVCFVRDGGTLGVKCAGMFDPGTLSFVKEGHGRMFAVRCQPLQAMIEKSLSAWDATVGAVVTAMSAVAIINSKGVSATEASDLAALNRKRQRNGKPPLTEYHTVRIRDEVLRQIRPEGSQPEEGVRLHWRRGHFKSRKTGLYWWNPHLAGRKELGMVEKHYVA